MRAVNQSLELNPLKDNVRDEIIAQSLTWSKRLCKKKLNILTLPGSMALFEQKFVSEMSEKGIKVTGDCIEHDWDNFHSLNDYLPKCLTSHVGKIEDFTDGKYDIIWLDYCGNPSPERMKTLKKVLDNNPVSLVYVTFQTDGTHYHGGREKLIQELSGGKKQDIPAALRYYATHMRYASLCTQNLIMDILYAGGETQKTGMITLGFQAGKVKVLPLNEQDWLTPIREQRKAKYGLKTPLTEKEAKIALAMVKKDENPVNKALSKAEVLVQQIKTLKEELDTLNKPVMDSPSWLNDKKFIAYYCRQGLTNDQIAHVLESGVYEIMDDCEKRKRSTAFVTDKRKIAAITNHVKKNRKAA